MFRQDRTNPSTAVSNWRGRHDTPRAWPSTAVSTWLNGGLFGVTPNSFEALQSTVFGSDAAVSNFYFGWIFGFSVDGVPRPDAYFLRPLCGRWHFARWNNYPNKCGVVGLPTSIFDGKRHDGNYGKRNKRWGTHGGIPPVPGGQQTRSVGHEPTLSDINSSNWKVSYWNGRCR